VSRLSTLALVFAAALPALTVSAAWADGCYTCGGGSKDACRDYCRYSGQDTFAARKGCESKGCKVSGTAACPTAEHAKICLAPVPAGASWAVAARCVAPPRS
jgi:hypothetical protein